MRACLSILSTLSALVNLAHARASIQQLPHEVLNVNVNATQTAAAVAAVQAVSVSYITITALITTTATSTETQTEIATTTETATLTTTLVTTLPPPPPPVTPAPTYTTITPSPSAVPVEITAQSQVVTTYFEEAVWCVGPAVYYSMYPGAPFYNGSANGTQIVTGTGSCSTIYSAAPTTVCATTITGLASRVTVTECEQEVSFSSENGYTMVTPTPSTVWASVSDSNGASGSASPVTITAAPTLQRLVTYWLAPWQALTSGGVPSSVDVKICTLDAPTQGRRTCQRYREVWEVVVVTSTLTTSRSVELLTTLKGPGTLVVQTTQSYVTDTIVTVDLSTTLLLETEREVESTSVSVLQRKVSTPLVLTPTETRRSTSTRYITKHLELRPTSVAPSLIRASSAPVVVVPSPSSSSSDEPTTTVLLTSTSTVTHTGTITRTRVRTGARG
jgi:hypothetical protein